MRKQLLLLGTLLAMLIPVAAFAAGEEYEKLPIVVLTYSEALALALEDVPAIQNLENRIAELQKERNDLNEAYRLTRWQISAAAADGLRSQITELNRQIEHMSLEIDTIKLRREQALINAIAVIANAAIDIETAEASIVITSEQVRRTGRLHSFGFASASELRIAQARLTQEQVNLDNLLITKANGLSTLNHLLGQPVYQQTYVELERELPEIPGNLTNHIESTVLQAPSIRQMRFDIYRRREDMAQHRAVYRYLGVSPRRNCETCQALQSAYDIAVLQQTTAIRAMDTALRAAYNNLEQLQNQESAARLALGQAEEALQIAQTNFELGRVTQFEIDSALFSIFSAQQAIERILNQQWVMMLVLENPALL